MTEIYESRKGKEGNPLHPFDETTKQTTDTMTGSWYLTSDLYIEDGSRLLVQGELRERERKRERERERESERRERAK